MATKPRISEYDPGLEAHLKEYPSEASDIPEGFVPEVSSRDEDVPPGFVLESRLSAKPSSSPGRRILTGDWRGAGEDLAWLGRTIAQDPGRAAKVLGNVLYDFTLGPLISSGQVLTQGRTPEQAAAWEAMTPEQQALARESGQQYASPYDSSVEQLQPQVEALQGGALVGSFVGKRGGGPLTRTRSGPSQARPRQVITPEVMPPQGPRPLLELPASATPPMSEPPVPVARSQRALPPGSSPLALPPANRPRFMVRESGDVVPIEGPAYGIPESVEGVEVPRTGLLDVAPRPTVEAAQQFNATVQRYRGMLQEVTRLEDAGLPVPKEMRRQLLQDWESLQFKSPTEVPSAGLTPVEPVGPPSVPKTAKGPVATSQARDQARLARVQAKIDKLNAKIEAEKVKGSASSMPEAPVIYKGYQEGFGKVPGFDLYDLQKTLSDTLVKGSSVTEKTLREAGYRLPQGIKSTVSKDVTLRAGFDPKEWAAVNALRVLASKARMGGEPLPAHVWNVGKEVFHKVLGPDVAEKLDLMQQQEKVNSNRLGMRLGYTPLQKLNPQESLNLVDVARGRAAPVNAKVDMAAQNWNHIRTDTSYELMSKGGEIYKPGRFDATSGARLQTGGYKPYKPVENYYPEFPDYRYIAKTPDAQLVVELNAEMPKTKPEVIQDIVSGLRAQAEGKALPTTVGPDAMRLLRKIQTVTPHLMERTGIVWPSKWLLPPQEALPLYAKNIAHELAVLEHVGPRDAGIEGPLSQAAKQGVPGIDLAYKVWDELIRGRAPHDPVSRSVDQFHSILGNIATMNWITPKTTIKQFSQVGLVAGEARSLMNFLRAFPKAVSKVGKLDADWWGATFGDIERELLMASRKEGGHPAATWLDTLERKTRHGATWAVYTSKTPQADAFGRRLGYHMALQDIADLQAAAQKGDTSALRWLKEDFNLDAQSPVDKMKFEAARWTNKVNLRTGPLDTPVIAHMPRMKAAFHLQKFNLSWTNRLYNGYVKPLTQAIKSGDKEAIARHIRRSVQLSGAGIIVGEMISDSIHALVARADDRPGGSFTELARDIVRGDVKAKNLVYRALDDMAFAGMFGYLQLVKEGILAPGSAIESASRLVGLKTGAGWSNVIELAAHAGQVAKTTLGGDDKERNRALRAAGRAVVSRIPVGGFAVAPRIFAGSESRERERALANIQRAIKRGDWPEVARQQEWFRARHGKGISPEAIGKALQR